MTLNSVPPFWTVAIAIFVVLFILAEFPRAGGALVLVLVAGMLITAKSKGVI